jgi:hypothetical protein
VKMSCFCHVCRLGRTERTFRENNALNVEPIKGELFEFVRLISI